MFVRQSLTNKSSVQLFYLLCVVTGSQSLELNSADEIETIELRDTVVTSTHENGPIEIHVTDENGLEYNLDDISYVES